LMRVYKDLEMVEQLGSGIPRILETYGKECFYFSENFLRMVFPAIEKVTEQDGLVKGLVKGLVDGLVESQQQIIRLVLENPKISKREMAKKVGISTTAIDKNIASLKEKKFLKRVGSDRTGHWEVVKNEIH
jgi:ATP-dependent DNA helicase RecG